jgi:hypothetical protein
MRGLWKLAGIAVPLLAAGVAWAQDEELGQNLISVVTSARHMPLPSARCLVWADAESFNLGPDELSGAHGINFYIEPKQLPSENAQPTSFEAGLASLKATYPKTPAWLIKTLEKNKSAIEAACQKDYDMPFKIYAITKKDTVG